MNCRQGSYDLNAERPAALVLDAHLKSALAAIRSLGSRGVRVIAGSDRRTAMGLHSKYVDKAFLYPSPLRSPADFLEGLVRETGNCGRLVLYTFSDATFLPCYEHRRWKRKWLPVCPASEKSVAVAYDKIETLHLATDLGIEVPPTRFLRSLHDLDSLAWVWRNPLVIKPRHSTVWRHGEAVQSAADFVFSRDKAKALCRRMIEQTGELPFLQEYIPGEEAGAEFLADDGNVVAAFAHRRIRSLSPVGGAAVVKQAVSENYKGIGEYGRRLVAALRWTGPIMVEFKIDRRDGRPKLMEINGRFWGSLPLAVIAGVDFPWLYYCMAAGRDPCAPRFYAQGVTSRHWTGDVVHLMRALFRRDSMRPVAYPARLASLREFFFPVLPMRSDVATLDDIGPAVAEIADGLWRALKRLSAAKSRRGVQGPAFSEDQMKQEVNR